MLLVCPLPSPDLVAQVHGVLTTDHYGRGCQGPSGVDEPGYPPPAMPAGELGLYVIEGWLGRALVHARIVPMTTHDTKDTYMAPEQPPGPSG
jgi:hypothetical protein